MRLPKGWTRTWRASGLIELACPHGVGHPDPNSITQMDQWGPPGSKGSWGVHGCDGCCTTFPKRGSIYT
jgi:hypothetical protein